ncbi:unnamed protein product, partial [Meganyctiphanes norvegica]
MWSIGGDNQGGMSMVVVGPGYSSEAPKPPGSTESPHPQGDIPKGRRWRYFSQNDSGFLSGSNLLSSTSSVSEDGPGYSSEAPKPPGSTVGGDTSKTNINTTSRLDSGIDISDQLNSPHLSSSGVTTSSGSLVGGRALRPPSPQRRPRLGLNPNQVALLQEIFQRDEDGDTQLHIAVMRGFIEVVYHITRLLPHQAFLDLPNNTGRTALHLAVAAGDSNVARHLIVCGASPVVRDRRGNTPLHTASGLGDAHLVNQLTRPVTVAEVMQAQLSYAPAHTAGLLAADLANYDGQTCIHIAAQMGSKDILQHLTWYGADINAKEGKGGRTALHYAVDARDPTLVLFVVEACRASVNQQTYAGLTPYQLALANGATALAQLLLELGAPGEPLPDYLLHQDDLDYDDESLDLPSEVSGTVNGWGGMDDLKIGGVPVPLGMNVPVTQAPLNADLYL